MPYSVVWIEEDGIIMAGGLWDDDGACGESLWCMVIRVTVRDFSPWRWSAWIDEY